MEQCSPDIDLGSVFSSGFPACQNNMFRVMCQVLWVLSCNQVQQSHRICIPRALDAQPHCAQVPMRERHECHCMLFLKDDNPFAQRAQGFDGQGAEFLKRDGLL